MPTPLELDSALKRVAQESGTEVRGFWRAVIDDPRAVPVVYRREMLDKQAIVKDVLAGCDVPGVHLEFTYILSDPQRVPEVQEEQDAERQNYQQ